MSNVEAHRRATYDSLHSLIHNTDGHKALALVRSKWTKHKEVLESIAAEGTMAFEEAADRLAESLEPTIIGEEGDSRLTFTGANYTIYLVDTAESLNWHRKRASYSQVPILVFTTREEYDSFLLSGNDNVFCFQPPVETMSQARFDYITGRQNAPIRGAGSINPESLRPNMIIMDDVEGADLANAEAPIRANNLVRGSESLSEHLRRENLFRENNHAPQTYSTEAQSRLDALADRQASALREGNFPLADAARREHREVARHADIGSFNLRGSFNLDPTPEDRITDW